MRASTEPPGPKATVEMMSNAPHFSDIPLVQPSEDPLLFVGVTHWCVGTYECLRCAGMPLECVNGRVLVCLCLSRSRCLSLPLSASLSVSCTCSRAFASSCSHAHSDSAALERVTDASKKPRDKKWHYVTHVISRQPDGCFAYIVSSGNERHTQHSTVFQRPIALSWQ
jgi:hypothetical protein